MKLIDSSIPLQDLQNYLEEKGWIGNEVVQRITIPGEGNMNVVLRIDTDHRSFILKQSRPFVQKYQQIEAPVERINTEYEFYKAIGLSNLDKHVPDILNFDSQDYLMMLEFVEDFQDMVKIYEEGKIGETELNQLIHILNSIHKSSYPKDYSKNIALRKLNHQHIFLLPFLTDNGFQLDDVQPGLQELSIPFKESKQLKTSVERIGVLYLSDGEYLLHGDYYPGSWMRVNGNISVIDPEFSFIGFREFDIGVMIAHIVMATGKEDYIDKIIKGCADSPNETLIHQVTGIEIIRRLIGLAQLPLVRSLEEKDQLLQLAHRLIVS